MTYPSLRWPQAQKDCSNKCMLCVQQREAHNFGAIAVVVEALLPYPSLAGLRPKKITATNAGMFDGGLQADYEKRRPDLKGQQNQTHGPQ